MIRYVYGLLPNHLQDKTNRHKIKLVYIKNHIDLNKKFMRRSSLLAYTACICLLSTTGCTPLERNHGNLIQDHQIEQISNSKHTKQTVLKILGSPTTKAPFDDNTWYYIGQKTQIYGIAKPDIVDQKILSITFNPDGRVETIETVDAQTLNNFPVVDSETPTAGTEKNPVRDFLSNLGRFNQPVPGAGGLGGDGDVGGPGGGL